MNTKLDPPVGDTRTQGRFNALSAELRLIAFMVAYTAAAVIVAVAFDMKWPFIETISTFWATRVLILFCLILAILLAIGFYRNKRLTLVPAQIVNAAMFLSLPNFLIGFAVLKNTLHLFPGVNFDAETAALDRWLHFGVDPWRAYLPVLDHLTFLHGSAFYHPVWTAHLLLAPALIIMLDRNRLRRLGYIITYVLSWVLLGNILAATFYSVGPIFVSPVLGDDARFAEMMYLSAREDFNLSYFRPAIDFLIERRLSGEITTGAAISAMPSMHLAMAAVIGIYIIRLRWWLTPISVFYVGVIQAFSVLSGMHYAIDGYVSIIAVGLIWWTVHRKLKRAADVA